MDHHRRMPGHRESPPVSSVRAPQAQLRARQRARCREAQRQDRGDQRQARQDQWQHGDGRGRPAGKRALQDDGDGAGDDPDGAHAVRGAADRDRLGLRHVRGLRLLAHPRASGASRASAGGARPTPISGRDDEVWTTDTHGIEGPPPTPALPGAAGNEGANDNTTMSRWIMPESDVELFYKQGVSVAANETICSQDLYDGYKLWSKGKGKRPLNHSRFSEEFERLGYTTVQIGGRQRYVGLALTPELLAALEKKPSFRRRKASELAEQVPEAVVEPPKPDVIEGGPGGCRAAQGGLSLRHRSIPFAGAAQAAPFSSMAGTVEAASQRAGRLSRPTSPPSLRPLRRPSRWPCRRPRTSSAGPSAGRGP